MSYRINSNYNGNHVRVIKDKDKLLYPIDILECNYMSLSLIPASGTMLLICSVGLCVTVCHEGLQIFQRIVGHLCMRTCESGAETALYIPQHLWDVITCSCIDTCLWHTSLHDTWLWDWSFIPCAFLTYHSRQMKTCFLSRTLTPCGRIFVL